MSLHNLKDTESDYELQDSDNNDFPIYLLDLFQNIIKYNNIQNKSNILVNPNNKTIARITMNMIILEKEYNKTLLNISNFKDELKNITNENDYEIIIKFFLYQLNEIECNIIHKFNSDYKKLNFELKKIKNNYIHSIYIFSLIIIIIIFTLSHFIKKI